MNETTTSREKVLKKIRNALIYKNQPPVIIPDKTSNAEKETDDIRFAEQFILNGGKFVFCEAIQDIAKDIQILIDENGWKSVYCCDEDLKQLFSVETNARFSAPNVFAEKKPEIAIVLCDALIADSGSILMSSNLNLGIPFNALPDLLIVVAGINQIVPDWKTALKFLSEIYTNKALGQLQVLNGKKHKVNISKDTIGKDVFLFLIENPTV